MTYEERNNIVAIVTNLLLVSYFGWRVYDMHQQGAFAGPDGLMLWAQTVIWIIPASIVLTIVLTIVFNILFSIATNDGDPRTVVDERDRAIRIRGMQVTMIVASAGFVAAVLALALGWTAFIVLNMIFAAFALGALAGDLTRFGLYRRGV